MLGVCFWAFLSWYSDSRLLPTFNVMFSEDGSRFPESSTLTR